MTDPVVYEDTNVTVEDSIGQNLECSIPGEQDVSYLLGTPDARRSGELLDGNGLFVGEVRQVFDLVSQIQNLSDTSSSSHNCASHLKPHMVELKGLGGL